MTDVMFIVAAAAVWILLALIVYSFPLFPFTLWLKSPIRRSILLALLAGLLGPGGVGGHGFMPLPSTIGLWMSLPDDPSAAFTHGLFWFATAICLLVWDKALRWLFRKHIDRAMRFMSRFFFGPFSWPLWQWFSVYLVASGIFFVFDPTSQASYISVIVMMAVAMLASGYFLGTRNNPHGNDYRITVVLMTSGLFLFCVFITTVDIWLGLALCGASILGGSSLLRLYELGRRHRMRRDLGSYST